MTQALGQDLPSCLTCLDTDLPLHTSEEIPKGLLEPLVPSYEECGVREWQDPADITPVEVGLSDTQYLSSQTLF